MKEDAHECCALAMAIRYMRQGWPGEGDRTTCPACGESYIRTDGRWRWASTAEEIRDLNATDPRSVHFGKKVEP